MRCRECDAVLETPVFPGGHLRCPACGTENVVDAPAVEAPAAGPYRAPSRPPAPPPVEHVSGARDLGPLCPRCTRLLHATDGPDLECATCGGAFVDHGDLAARVDAARPNEPQPGAPRHARGAPRERDVHYARCPTCAQPMTRMNFGVRSGIILDVCRTHGTWFDRGELDAALSFVRAGGLEDHIAPPQTGVTDLLVLLTGRRLRRW